MAAMLEPVPEIKMTMFFTLGLSLLPGPKKGFVAAKTVHLRTVVLKTAFHQSLALTGDTFHGFGIHTRRARIPRGNSRMG
jgi:hypothetical protein